MLDAGFGARPVEPLDLIGTHLFFFPGTGIFSKYLHCAATIITGCVKGPVQPPGDRKMGAQKGGGQDAVFWILFLTCQVDIDLSGEVYV